MLDLLLSEKQMEGRFDNVVTMRPMITGPFAGFVAAYEQMLPLRLPSNVRNDPAPVQALWTLSGGYVGRLSRVMKKLCRAAVETKRERVSCDLLEKVAGRGLRDAANER